MASVSDTRYKPWRQPPNLVGASSSPVHSSSGTVGFSSFWATEGCAALDKGWRWRECNSCSEDVATWTRSELLQGRHACRCFALAYGSRRRWILYGKLARVKETFSYTVCEFHTFWTNSFWAKKCGALLSEQSSKIYADYLPNWRQL